MNTILNLIQNYYGGIIGTGVSVTAIVKVITSWFQKYVISNMLILQKDTTLTNEQKFAKLTTDVYNGLPLFVRLFMTQNSFAQLSQGLYDKVFPPKNIPNTPVVDSNAEIKQAIANIITDAIDGLEKSTDVKIQQAVVAIQDEKKNELNKIADTLKQSLDVNTIDTNPVVVTPIAPVVPVVVAPVPVVEDKSQTS